MIGNNAGVMERYTVYKSAMYNANPKGYLPPNYHLKRARQNEESTQRYGNTTDRFESSDSGFDFFTPDAFAGSQKNEREEESLLSLFKKLNDRLFGGRRSFAQPEVSQRPAAPAYSQPRIEESRNVWNNNKAEDALPPQLRNTWYNVVDIKGKAPQKSGDVKMCQNLENWCNSEYQQTREEDEAFYAPQELRDRIAVLRDINNDVKSVDKKSSAPAQATKEPWDYVTPLPLQAKGLDRYESMEDAEDYRSLYYSNTVEAVA